MRDWWMACAAALALGATGCANCDGGTKKGDDGAEPQASPSGLEHPDNDPKVVAELEKVVECELAGQSFSPRCTDFEKLRRSDLVARGNADATLVHVLEDDETKARLAAALLLREQGRSYRKDPELARLMVTALEKETDENVARQLAAAVAEIDLEATELENRVVAMVQGHELGVARRVLVTRLPFRNQDSDAVHDAVAEIAREADDPDLRVAAVRAFSTRHTEAGKGKVCALWVSVAQKDDAARVAERAASLAAQAQQGACKEHYDALLDLVAERARQGAAESSHLGHVLKYVYEQEQSTSEQKERALEIAERLLENTGNDGSARAAGLRLLGEEKPGGKKIAKAYLEDEARMVKMVAEGLAGD